MRRTFAMIAVLGGLTAGVGCCLCEHVGGKFDCGYNPADYPIGAPTAAHTTYPVPGVVTPAKDADPMKGKDGTGSDKTPDKGMDEKK